MSKVTKHKPKTKPEAGEKLLTIPCLLQKKDLTQSQHVAVDLFDQWYYKKKHKEQQVLRIGGFSGTGKSTLISYLINHAKFEATDCYVLAYTGQAVNRLREDGIMARTIHSTIMYTVDEQVIDPRTKKPIYKRGVPLMRVTFKPLRRLPNKVKLIIVDEASFLPKKLEDILKGYNVPILELGDPLQLPPVGGAQCFNEDNLDFMMTDVMRQHMDSELYDVINRIRLRKNIYTHNYHDEVLFLYQQPTIEETFFRFIPFFKNADLIVTATNKQRQVICDMYRQYILHAPSPYPMEGEKMICRQNNQQLMIDQYILTNGTLGYSMHDVGRSLIDKKADIFYMDFQPYVTENLKTAGIKYFANLPCDCERLMAPFGSVKMDLKYPHPGEKFEYAHAITTHLIQGGSADTVIFMDGYSPDFEYLMRLRYTAASRARKRLIYLIPYTKWPGWFDLSHVEERMQRAREYEEQQAAKEKEPERPIKINKYNTFSLPR